VLHVLTYVVSYKLFWNWIGVVRFISQEVWFNKGFVIWHFLSYYWEQIVSLWSLSIEVRIILTTNDRLDTIRYLKSTASQNDIKMNFYETMRRRPDFCMQQNAPQARPIIKIRRRPGFLTESLWIVSPIDIAWVCNSFFGNSFSRLSVQGNGPTACSAALAVASVNSPEFKVTSVSATQASAGAQQSGIKAQSCRIYWPQTCAQCLQTGLVVTVQSGQSNLWAFLDALS